MKHTPKTPARSNLPTRQEWEAAGFTPTPDICAPVVKEVMGLVNACNATEPPLPEHARARLQQAVKHTTPPESIQTIQRVLNNAGESLRHRNESESSDCFEAARRLNLIADERADLLQALRDMLRDCTCPLGQGKADRWKQTCDQARAAIAKAEKGEA